MASTPVSAFDLFKPSVAAVKRNMGAFVALILLPTIVITLASLMSGNNNVGFSGFPGSQVGTSTATKVDPAYAGVMIAVMFYTILTLAAVPYLELKASKGKIVSFSEAFQQGLKYFWRILGLYIITALLFVVGLILLIVPGLIVLRRYILAPYFLIDKNLPIEEAMKQSAAISKPYSSAVWGVIGVSVLLAFTGFIPLIGAAVSAILAFLYSCAFALRYEELKKLPVPEKS